MAILRQRPDHAASDVVRTCRFALRSHPWLAYHEMLGEVLFPGAAVADLVIQAGRLAGHGRIAELVLHDLLALDRDGAGVDVQIRFGVGDGRQAVDVYARKTDAGPDDWVCFAAGIVTPEQSMTATSPLSPWPPVNAESVDTKGLYEMAAANGFRYGAAFRGLTAAWRQGNDVYATVELPADQAAEFGLHPALFDAALHTIGVAAGLGVGGDDPVMPAASLPFLWSGVTIHATRASALRVHLHVVSADTVSMVATDPAGTPVVRVESLVLREVARDGRRTPVTLHTEELANLTAASCAPLPECTVLATPGPTAASLRHGLVKRDTRVLLGEDLDAGSETVVLPMAGGAPGPPDVAVLRASIDRLATTSSRLIVVTEGMAAGTAQDASASAIWGIARAARSRHPDRIVLIDLDAAGLASGALEDAVASGAPEVIVRDGVLLRPQLAQAHPPRLEPPAGRWRLDAPAGTATLADLRMVEHPGAAGEPAPGQVRVALRAAGVNFRDVLIGLGMYPEPGLMGSEGAGVVTAVGPGVTDLVVGDRVMGLFEGAFTPVAVADQRTLVRVPEGWSYAQAATVPVVFLTAYYGLHDLAGVRRGERLLVHAAAGGVGMAAVQLAQAWGLEVFGTASPAKWPALRANGLDARHIGSSRDLSFADGVRDVTGGAGVEVVLNSLTRDFVDSSLALVRPGGRFLDIGKLDVRDADRVAADHRAVRYRQFDAMEAGLDRIQQILRAVADLFRQGVLRPLPVRCWDVRDAPEALRHLQRARNVGKVVLTMPPPRIQPGTVLVTGETGATYSAVTQFLTETGAEVVTGDPDDGDLLARVTAVVQIAPDPAAAWRMHELTARMPSVSAFVTWAPETAETATFLAGLARYRRAQGLPAVAVAASPATLSLSTVEGRALVEAAITGIHPAVLARRTTATSTAAAAPSVPRVDVTSLAEPALVDLVAEQTAVVLGLAGPVDPDVPFGDYGLDSLTAVELRNRLAAATGMTLPVTMVFDYPTSAEVARHLRREVTAAPAEPPPRPRAATPAIDVDDATDDEIFALLDGVLDAGRPAGDNGDGS